uniref:CD302 molecule n=1 Tax=Hucho hucho TaxID=62062 RepID=A0A4W5KZU7_9TELE
MESLKKCHLCPLYLCNFLFVVVCWQSTLAGDCPADGRTWVPFRQRCYHFVHGEEDVAKSYTIDAAKTICSGYELVSVQSAEENNFIIKYSPQVWKGNLHVWLGLYYDSDDEDFKWQDETGLSFNNWGNSSSESELIPMDTCVAMHSGTGEWEKVSCVEDQENGVVCETAETPSPLLSALVILSVVGIMGISAVVWFLHQKHQHGTVLTSFEYHPPFRSPTSDEACLVETEETDDMA